MTLDVDVFAGWWSLLDDRFPGQRADGQDTAYYRWLREWIDTESFDRAAGVIFAHNEFFPRPVDFVDVARGLHPEWPAVIDSAKRRIEADKRELEAGRLPTRGRKLIGGPDG